MLHKKFTKHSEDGFTIIEVLIVLAIAALILLIVFLAVPALQRSSRNNSRKNDASRVSTEIANFASNNNGSLPGETSGAFVAGAAAGDFGSDCTNIIPSVGTLSVLGGVGGKLTCANGQAAYSGGGANPATESAGNLNATQITGAGSNETFAANTVNWMYLVEGGVCPTTTNTTADVTLGDQRQSALLYPQETGSGSWNIACIQAT